MTAVSTAWVRASALVLWLTITALAGVTVVAQTGDEAAIGFESAVSPEELGPGSAFTLDGTVTIDPASEALEGSGGTIIWSLTIGPVDDVTIDGATCGETAGTSCEADLDADDATVSFTGTVEDDPRGDVTAEIEITGVIDDRLDRDTILFAADTCARVAVGAGTPAPAALGRFPASAATPEAACAGVEGTVEVTVALAVIPTEAPSPTATPTGEPTEAPTAMAEATQAPTARATPEPTEEPTVAPTGEPTATPEPTREPTVTPATTPTEEPTATTEPTEAPAATLAPTEEPTATPTVEPTVTAEPTGLSTAPAEATGAPTATTAVVPSDEAPTEEPTVAVAPVTDAPQPTLDDDDAGNAGLWIGVGSLLVLAAAAGAVLYQRRKLPA